ncbi:MAG: hypothetical protein ACTS9Y_10565 [Methylophilus sp.]|uniref:hypothetical protein n=1 Tax=Methylophilus sp. TaxID=29541 RepID=UPI003FA16BD0
MNKRFIHIWGWPIVLALLTGFGLLSALLGTGIWHWLSWAAIATPLLMMGYYWLIDKTR